jgi:hypothetical protein
MSISTKHTKRNQLGMWGDQGQTKLQKTLVQFMKDAHGEEKALTVEVVLNIVK